MARKSRLLESIEASPAGYAPAVKRKSHLPPPAVGALAASLQEFRSDGLREIAPDLVDEAGPIDRLPQDNAIDDDELMENIASYGQLVPVLLRPHPDDNGRYQVIYGRRRLNACKRLGIDVKANVRDMSDEECVVAQGIENNARKDLSYYERCRFAQAIADAGYDSTTIQASLNVKRNRVHEYLKVTKLIPSEIGDLIGAAPGIGRDRWASLADAFKLGKITTSRARSFLQGLDHDHSDDRFNALLTEAQKRGVQNHARTFRDTARRLSDGVRLSETQTKVTLTITKNDTKFGEWFSKNADALVQEMHTRFKDEADAKDQ